MGRLAEQQVVKERNDTCATCPRRDVKLNRCKACKCFLRLKTKFTNATCPEGRWKR